MTKLDGHRSETLQRPCKSLAWTSAARLCAVDKTQKTRSQSHRRRIDVAQLPWQQRITSRQDPANTDQSSQGRQIDHGLEGPTMMQGRDTPREICITRAAEARLLDQIQKGLLVGKPPDTLDQILIGGSIPRHELAQGRDDLE